MRHRLRQPAWPSASHERQSILWTFPENTVCHATQIRFAQMRKFALRIDGPKVWELWHVRAILKHLRRP